MPCSLGDGASGVFGVELFLLADGSILLNEVAPRPHNTGHYTQDACAVSQFENHLRGVAGLPLGDTTMAVGAAAMVNVLGAKDGTDESTVKVLDLAMTLPRTTVHWYNKKGSKPGRKMGHINVTGDSASELDGTLRVLLKCLGLEMDDTSDGGRVPPAEPLVGVIMGSDSDLPAMSACVDILKKVRSWGEHWTCAARTGRAPLSGSTLRCTSLAPALPSRLHLPRAALTHFLSSALVTRWTL